jgi:hypothetical protein
LRCSASPGAPGLIAATLATEPHNFWVSPQGEARRIAPSTDRRTDLCAENNLDFFNDAVVFNDELVANSPDWR